MIVSLASRPDDARLWPMIEEVFFLSSSVRDFPSPRARARFLAQWTGYYRDREPDRIYLSLAPTGRIEGYLMGCRDSRAAKRLYREVASYHLFEDLFDDYPAHFHVNCHPDFRCQGVGARLVDSFLAACADDAIGGVHVVTAADAANAAFYRKCGLDFAITRHWQDKELVFLGRRL